MKKQQIDTEEIVKQVLSNVTESFEELKQNFDWQLGIDEAGRGPVIGPMLYAACYWPTKYHQLISETCKFADSKQINEATRDKLFDVLTQLKGKVLTFETRELTAEYLSKNQLAHLIINLNDISHNTAADLIQNAIIKGYKITEIYVDTVGPKQTYRNFLQGKLQELGKVANIVVEEKADSKYANVSAASICAKVTRDYKITQIQQEILPNDSIGSGYPGDPKTKKYLENTNIRFFVFPKYIRFSWQTIKTIINDRDLNIDYKDEQEASKQVQNLTNFFLSKNQTKIYNYKSVTFSNCIL
ncbi:unnamed protein product [Paramecium primaurelia]|uniref:Ribonuclease n=1 Tax=Paramecium primaurelia TaxID=5886 RepID=A0A8S1PXW4_PARPR|nr:unnamed protein product [Paramecium primaurelia]